MTSRPPAPSDPTAGGEGASAPVLSARGTRLNRRGLRTREHLLREAVEALVEGGPDAASANALARRAGVTWGTVQHQFGDVDGLWAAVLAHVGEHTALADTPLERGGEVAERVRAVVDLLWEAIELPGAVAILRLRSALPRQREQLEQAYPLTARAIADWDEQWTLLCERSFAGLGLDPVRLERVRHLLPGAMRGISTERDLSTYVDADEARRGLVDAVTAYLVN